MAGKKNYPRVNFLIQGRNSEVGTKYWSGFLEQVKESVTVFLVKGAEEKNAKYINQNTSFNIVEDKKTEIINFFVNEKDLTDNSSKYLGRVFITRWSWQDNQFYPSVPITRITVFFDRVDQRNNFNFEKSENAKKLYLESLTPNPLRKNVEQ